jgi:heme/copper-type cytochrome/quinol oxidase subunit 2
VLADLPNCAEYPKACANYGQSSGLSGIVIAGLILLGVVLIVAAVLTVIIVRRRRRSPGARAPSDFDQPR